MPKRAKVGKQELAMALDLTTDVEGDLLDRVVHPLRPLLGAQRRALQPQGRLGDVLLGDRRVGLLAEDHLEACVLGDLAADAVETFADALAVLVADLVAPPDDLDLHGCSSRSAPSTPILWVRTPIAKGSEGPQRR